MGVMEVWRRGEQRITFATEFCLSKNDLALIDTDTLLKYRV